VAASIDGNGGDLKIIRVMEPPSVADCDQSLKYGLRTEDLESSH
jgi:hypothetical protein